MLEVCGMQIVVVTSLLLLMLTQIIAGLCSANGYSSKNSGSVTSGGNGASERCNT